jgi:tetratricopeptide (TPR) repeat protein
LIFITGDFERGSELQHQSLAMFRELGDDLAVAHGLHRLAVEAAWTGEHERALALSDESLSLHKRLGSPSGEAMALGVLADIAQKEKRYEEALELSIQSANLAAEVGFRWWQIHYLYFACEMCLNLGRPEEAERWGRDGLRLAVQIGDRQMSVYLLALLSATAAAQAESERAGVLWGALEREEERGPVGQWEGERDAYRSRVEPRDPSNSSSAGLAGDSSRGRRRCEQALRRLTAMAPVSDLREWIALLEREGELVRVSAEVDPHLEVTEIVDRTVKAGGPALLFEQPKDSSHPLLINQFGTERRMCLPSASSASTTSPRSSRTCSRCSRRRARRQGARAQEAEVDRRLAAANQAQRAGAGGRAHGRRGRSRGAADPDLLAGRRGAVHHSPGRDHEGPANRDS